MHLGWKRDRPALTEGVAYLSDIGPSPDRMYYNYFATQVMRHYEGDRWKEWNRRLRDDLVSAQARTGHEAGSWYFDGGDYGRVRAGRLYFTSLAALILESYYRYLSVYGPRDGDTGDAGRPAGSVIDAPVEPWPSSPNAVNDFETRETVTNARSRSRETLSLPTFHRRPCAGGKND